ncbi:Carbamoyltransferase HypF [subsurface metagenome]
MDENSCRVECIEVTGMVQGVGFRPFVHSLAKKFSLGGYVLNTPDGVIIEVEGSKNALDSFVSDLEHHAPPLSMIVSINRKAISHPSKNKTGRIYKSFEIRESTRDGQPVTLIPPDVCICEECLAELFDTENRRHLYPFINCTNCGPRFTIIRELPYDRPSTTMAGFTMCPECCDEYADPENRRFHAQPNACHVCGPQVKLLDSTGHPLSGEPIVTAINLLQEGKIIAVKGLGGFHLTVDGTGNDAVKRLRLYKNREEKPLALMVGSITAARLLIAVESFEEQILMSRERPILLAPRRDYESGGIPVAEAIAPGNPYLGIMLPYTPLHYLLFFHPEAGGDFRNNKPIFSALVMTSGNLSEEPVCKDNDEALKRLECVADAFLVHDRDIYVRCDDSVVSSTDREVLFIRRSRGFVPAPVFLPERTSPILALGGELKNTLCIVEGCRAFMSQHIGDLENIPTLDFFHEAVIHFKNILGIEPEMYAYDLHPDYLSTKYMINLRDSLDEELYGTVGVQHHHAHIASVLAEHGCSEPVIGFSMDGTGYGPDSAVWGGEILLCTPCSYSRAAHLDYIPMPGGTSAVREPWRMAFSYLKETYGKEWSSLNLPCLKQVEYDNLEVLARACETGLNCPRTSSLGRLFDAVASILDIRHKSAFEGQAAMMLEMLATNESASQIFPFKIIEDNTGSYKGYPELWGSVNGIDLSEEPDSSESLLIDYKPLINAIVEEIKKGRARTELALSFHMTVLSSFQEAAEKIREFTGINTAALSGGCWQNRILKERFHSMLEEQGFKVLTNRQVPPNDGGLALGQAYVASCISTLKKKRKKTCALQYR